MIKRLSFSPLLCLALVSCALPQWQGPRTDHFDGWYFRNPEPVDKSTTQFLRWMISRNKPQWKKIESAPMGAPPPERILNQDLRITFVNHATVLIQVDGLNVITDPIWSDHASPFLWTGPQRWHPPGIRFEDLPPIDVVMISHDHYDHLDMTTLERLKDEHDPRFLAGLGIKKLLRHAGIYKVTEMDWWDSWTLPNGRKIHAVPARHWSKRNLFGDRETLWLGFVMETADGPIYYSGDTGFGSHFSEIHQRFGNMRFSILGMGGYQPHWYEHHSHISPAAAVLVHRLLHSRNSIGVHFGTFRLGDDTQTGPVDDLIIAREAAGLTEWDIWAPAFGGAYHIKPDGHIIVNLPEGVAPPTAPHLVRPDAASRGYPSALNPVQRESSEIE